MFGQLHDNTVPGRQGGTKLPGLHEKGKVPWDDLAAHADRLVSRVAVVVAVQRDHLAVILVRPTGVVTIILDGQCCAGKRDGLKILNNEQRQKRRRQAQEGCGITGKPG